MAKKLSVKAFRTPDVKTTDDAPAPKPLPRLVQAAGLALAVMKAAGVSSWDQIRLLSTDPVPGAKVRLADRAIVRLDPEQVELLIDPAHTTPLMLLSPGTPDVTLVVCDTCGGWVLQGSGAAPARCKVTLGCEGSTKKASRAVSMPAAEIKDVIEALDR